MDGMACERVGFSPRIAHSFDDTVIAPSLVAAGMGVAILDRLAPGGAVFVVE